MTREVEGEFILYNPDTLGIVLINQTTALIFELCDGTRTEDEIAREVERRYESRPERLAEDIRTTIEQLAESGFIAMDPDE